MGHERRTDPLGIDPDEIFIIEDTELDLDDEVPSVEERRALARRLAEEARARASERRGLAARVSRPRSAREVLEEARRAEEAQRRAEEAERQRRRAQAEREAREEAEAAELAALERATFSPRRFAARDPADDVMALIESRITGVEVRAIHRAVPAAVVAPIWRAHALRARHEHDLAAALVADRVAEALDDRPDRVAAARVWFGGREWAVWCDLDADEVMAALAPADVYLVGLEA